MDIDVVYAEIHQHIGGKTMSVYIHKRKSGTNQLMCASTPSYGTGTGFGNEAGYVVNMPTCNWSGQTPYHLEKGDKMTLTSVYTSRTLPKAPQKGYHLGVMGLLYMVGHVKNRQETVPLKACTMLLISKCGSETTKEGCASCLGTNDKVIADSYLCTERVKQRFCTNLASQKKGSIPVPANLQMKATYMVSKTCASTGSKPVSCIRVTMATAPGHWFALALNPSGANMNGAHAHIYGIHPGDTKPSLKVVTLGAHTYGKALTKPYEDPTIIGSLVSDNSKVENVGGTTRVSFDLPMEAVFCPDPKDKQCAESRKNFAVLFARGATQYVSFHGNGFGSWQFNKKHFHKDGNGGKANIKIPPECLSDLNRLCKKELDFYHSSHGDYQKLAGCYLSKTSQFTKACQTKAEAILKQKDDKKKKDDGKKPHTRWKYGAVAVVVFILVIFGWVACGPSTDSSDGGDYVKMDDIATPRTN